MMTECLHIGNKIGMGAVGRSGFYYAARFDGVNDRMAYNRGGGNSMIYETADHTYEFWMKDIQGTNAWLFGKFFSSASNWTQLRFDGSATGVIYIVNTGPTTSNTITINYPFAANSVGRWLHIVVTYVTSTKTMKLYVNGAFIGSATHANAIVATNLDKDLEIGHGSINTIKGKLDELRIYTRALGAAEITANYNNGLMIPPTDISGQIMRFGFERSLSNAGSWGGQATAFNFAVDIYQNRY